MITIIGGTFAFLHPGHKELLRVAAGTGNRVVVGLTTDSYLEANKRYGKVPYEVREKKVSAFLESLGADFEVVPLTSREGNSATGEDYECIVVSRETESRASRINREREKNGLRPMRVIVVPYVLAEDLFPMSSTRIIEGEIDEDGKRIRPVRISIATSNHLKVEGVKTVFSTLMSNIAVEQDSRFNSENNQPFGDQVIELANERALFSLKDYDYSVGIEAGVFQNRFNNTYYDVHCAVVIDRNGTLTTGFSSGFQIPESIVRELKRGMDISSAFEKLKETPFIGSREGLVGYLSDNRVIRSDLIEEAVRNALIPRMKPETL